MKIKVLSKKKIKIVNGKESTFYTYFSPCMIQCFDKDGNDLGIQERNISVHFRKVASKKLDDEKVFAFIGSSKPEDIQLPFVYKPEFNDDTGKWEYDEIWIADFETFEPIPYKGRESTCVPILDEEEQMPETEIEE